MEWYWVALAILLYVWTVTIILKTALDIAKILAVNNLEERVDFAQQMHALKTRLHHLNEEPRVAYPPTYQ